ncbi:MULTISPECIES: ComEA family DNA-binding protein [unclassified Microbacterium]|uniref:ComEA family DNA-binding protein n=1 Tax=unclassified Microbacterium TaxID=2609290 RepID=UPI00214CB16C|nr:MULTISPECIES: ComEA family DNA-binding protein [unclassified Microbacterium]MCR2785552.1 ComEA family DNA-binding protein [Microbacterium sp. zg.B96]WIM17460.1 ComEA family DNA-binding protein [Microbacterium sp. zg-B96]
MTGEHTAPRARRRLGVGAVTVVVIAALAVTVAIGILRSTAAPVETVTITETDATPGPSAPVAAVYVHVSGAVAVPGLYRLDDGARVVDAIAAAGGFGEGADEAAVNLARIVGDGEQLHVPVVGEAVPAATAPGAAAPPGGGKVNLNTADLAALDTLPRIGPALAQRIIDWRDENGRFTSVDDLLAVPGIGDKMLAALRDLVTL